MVGSFGFLILCFPASIFPVVFFSSIFIHCPSKQNMRDEAFNPFFFPPSDAPLVFPPTRLGLSSRPLLGDYELIAAVGGMERSIDSPPLSQCFLFIFLSVGLFLTEADRTSSPQSQVAFFNIFWHTDSLNSRLSPISPSFQAMAVSYPPHLSRSVDQTI